MVLGKCLANPSFAALSSAETGGFIVSETSGSVTCSTPSLPDWSDEDVVTVVFSLQEVKVIITANVKANKCL